VDVVRDPEVIRSYSVDWTGRWRGDASAVLRPRNLDEVAASLAWCVERGIAVVPQGGNTGLVGGGVPVDGAAVLSLRGLDAVVDVDPDAGQLTAGAGATIASVQAAAAAAGWAYGLDWGARESATVGGSIATNAGGVRVIRHGDTRAQLVGIEAVLADGSIVSRLGGLVKDNTGYHLPSLLCGSEGTLGIVTAARLRLVPRYEQRVVAVVGLASMADAVSLAGHIRRTVADVDALEVFTDECRQLVGVAPPVGSAHAVWLLVECAGHDEPTAALAAAVEDRPAAVGGPTEPGRRAELWRIRHSITEAINAVGPPVKLDVTLPGPRLATFCDEVPSVLPAGARLWLFGHVADGNIHVNVTGIDPTDESVDDAVLRLVADHEGSISAEHGIGRAKRPWLHLVRTAAELGAMGAVKAALDPAGILNPGVLLPEVTTAGSPER
jgi:FAD/FMN-containing dehydrogenase